MKHHRLMGMDRHTLAVFLDDLTWEKFGLGRYYVVNKYVSGQVRIKNDTAAAELCVLTILPLKNYQFKSHLRKHLYCRLSDCC